MTGVWTTDENYNQDDMGISRWYNNQNIFANISYEIFSPTKYFNQFEFKLSVRHGRRYTPSIKRNNNYEAELFFETNKLFKNRLELELRTLNKDFFEPRVDGLFVLKPKEFSFRYDLDSDNTKDFDVIFLDTSLPDKSGEELVTEVLQITKNIPVIVLTGYLDESFATKTIQLGASDFILKDQLSSENIHKSILTNIERFKKKALVKI